MPTKQSRFKYGKHYVLDERGCWLWLMTISKDGYGRLYYKSVDWRAHRLSYVLHKGEIPEGLLVCHTCDVRRCVNPDHLFLGTFLDNHTDMRSKGRGSYREDIKTKQGELIWIQKFLDIGCTQSEVADLMGMSQTTISKLIKKGLLND